MYRQYSAQYGTPGQVLALCPRRRGKEVLVQDTYEDQAVRRSLPAWRMAAVQAVGTGPMVPCALPLVSLCSHKSLEKLL